MDKKNTALTELDQNIRAARTERDGANNLKAQWDEYEQRLKQLADLRRGVQELDVSRAALDKAGQHHQAIEGKRAELASLPTVDADQLDKLEKLDKDIAECRINLNALSVTVELEPQADGVVEVEQSGTTENTRSQPARPQPFTPLMRWN